MRVRSAMLFALGLPAPACVVLKTSVDGCDPPERAFVLEGELTETDVADLLSIYTADDASELDCAQVCEHLEYEASGWWVTGTTTCDLVIDDAADTAGVVGSLYCDGTEIEYYCEGRRPLGHVEAPAAEGLAGYLAGAAHLEAASVLAFEELAGQLERWGAPAALVSRCRLAADEERAHAVAVGGLATALGGAPPTPACTPAPEDLYSAALHNAVEGCVHETWAALMAWCKASRATTPELRRIYAELAGDESGHAQLAWDLHAWMLGRLDPTQRASVIQAQAEALARLPERAAWQARNLPPELGLPDPEYTATLARRFVSGLRAQA